MTEELKRCYSCGKRDAEIGIDYVRCNKCDVSVNQQKSMEAAIDAWNRMQSIFGGEDD